MAKPTDEERAREFCSQFCRLDAYETGGCSTEQERALVQVLRAVRADERTKADGPWKQAVIDAAVVGWTYRKEHETDPRAAVNALLVQAQREALDPTISEEARRLHATAAREGLRRAAGHLRYLQSLAAFPYLDNQYATCAAELERLAERNEKVGTTPSDT